MTKIVVALILIAFAAGYLLGCFGLAGLFQAVASLKAWWRSRRPQAAAPSPAPRAAEPEPPVKPS